jgi:hypothetical protein
MGIRCSGWKQALQAFTIYFDGKISTHETRRDHLHRRSDAPMMQSFDVMTWPTFLSAYVDFPAGVWS